MYWCYAEFIVLLSLHYFIKWRCVPISNILFANKLAMTPPKNNYRVNFLVTLLWSLPWLLLQLSFRKILLQFHKHHNAFCLCFDQGRIVGGVWGETPPNILWVGAIFFSSRKGQSTAMAGYLESKLARLLNVQSKLGPWRQLEIFQEMVDSDRERRSKHKYRMVF